MTPHTPPSDRGRPGAAALRALVILLLLSPLAGGCMGSPGAQDEQEDRVRAAVQEGLPLDTAILAGGCFWCMEPPFDELDGVLSTTSGFVGGEEEAPSYEEVVRGLTGHTEAVQVVFDPARVSYEELLAVFWPNVDPLDGGGQFCDRGPMYRPGVFVRDEAQRTAAEASRAALAAAGFDGVEAAVEVTTATPFWAAEEYHQAYYLKNPVRYRVYRTNCGRDRRLDEVWGRGRDVPPEVREALGLAGSGSGAGSGAADRPPAP